MLIGRFMEYKGFVGSIEFDAINKIYHGKLLNIEDLVNYQADNIINLHEQYHLAIDDYIEMKEEIKKRMNYEECKYYEYEDVTDWHNDVFDHPSYKSYCTKTGEKRELCVPSRQCQRCGGYFDEERQSLS